MKINSILFLALLTVCVSCEDYLDKAPEADISDREVFGNFTSFQGWVEEMYSCMANHHAKMAANYHNTFNMPDMMLNTTMFWDDGNYWDDRFLFDAQEPALGGTSGLMSKSVWPLAWYAIRKANVGLQHMDLLEGTQDEKNLIKGQCLFFRAFYHLELIQYYGGLPYVDNVLDVNEPFSLPRLSYIETARRIAEDFRAAAELLPMDWKNTNTLVSGSNGVRATQIHALAYLGKNLLYAASPMMNESSIGVNTYDTDLCRQAAAAFAEVIRLSEDASGDCPYYLESWDNWSGIFKRYTAGRNERPGGAEVIQNQMIYEPDFYIYTNFRAQAPVIWGFGNDKTEVPTHNYVKYYAMANGLPVEDPDSGYDPNDPWKGREPRFYHDIVYEGTKMVENATTDDAKKYQYAHLHNNGFNRQGSVASGGVNGSVTGYMYWKFMPSKVNFWENGPFNAQAWQPRLRMADVYLMYAEAVFYGYGSATGKDPNSAYTAQQAIEKIRSRAQLSPLPDKYYANGNTPLFNFKETLIRERAVELAFEGHRWFDLRRWNIAGELKYREKYGINFDVNESLISAEYPTGKPYNFKEVLLTTRVFEKKHNWVPLPTKFTQLYEEFYQNPGW